MKTLYITFTYTIFKLIFENNLLADNFEVVFQATTLPNKQFDNIIDVKGDDDTDYSVYLNNKLVQKEMTREEAAYCITRIFGDDICSHVNDSICIMHAASVLTNKKIVSFLGVSGSGKTSLSLIFSKYGKFVGDEYAFLDIKKGYMWHEQHPYQLKERNEDILHKINSSLSLAVKGESFGRAYYISLGTINYQKVEYDDNLKVKVFVFPKYDRNCTRTLINRLSISKLPNVILQSLMGKDLPSLLFKRFIHMAAEEQLYFIEIKFSDGDNAAVKLFEYINNEMNEVNK